MNLIKKLEKNGVVLIGGSFFPNDGAFFIFCCQNEIVIDDFVKEDPYYVNGLVSDYEIKEIELFTEKEVKDLALYYKYR